MRRKSAAFADARHLSLTHVIFRLGTSYREDVLQADFLSVILQL